MYIHFLKLELYFIGATNNTLWLLKTLKKDLCAPFLKRYISYYHRDRKSNACKIHETCSETSSETESACCWMSLVKQRAGFAYWSCLKQGYDWMSSLSIISALGEVVKEPIHRFRFISGDEKGENFLCLFLKKMCMSASASVCVCVCVWECVYVACLEKHNEEEIS